MKLTSLMKNRLKLVSGFVLLLTLALPMTLAACGGAATPLATSTAGPNLAATVDALATKISQSSGVVETAQALETLAAQRPTYTPSPTITPLIPTATGTQLGPLVINLPADIPLPPGELRDLFASQNLVSFLMLTDFNQLITFYEKQMAINGWLKEGANSYITGNSAVLNYSKSSRKASVSLRFNQISNLTGIVITIE
jgi:hypothetical protein